MFAALRNRFQRKQQCDHDMVLDYPDIGPEGICRKCLVRGCSFVSYAPGYHPPDPTGPPCPEFLLLKAEK